MEIEARIVNAFTEDSDGGNPAGVVLEADELNVYQKQAAAQRIGVSETAFVSASAVATVKLEFFTPTRQIAHCGHATIATFSLLRQLDRIGDGRFTKETIDGTRDIFVEGSMTFMEQRKPLYSPVSATSWLGTRIAASLGCGEDRLAGEPGPCIVNTGNAFLLVPLPDEATVARVRPRFNQVEVLSEELDLIGYYLFSTKTRRPGRHAGARMFAPRFGIEEEAGTGMAAGPLACYLHDRFGIQDRKLLIEQGWLMEPPSPSLITVVLELEKDRITGLVVGGTTRVASTLRLEL